MELHKLGYDVEEIMQWPIEKKKLELSKHEM
jgi:hypothetical protein